MEIIQQISSDSTETESRDPSEFDSDEIEMEYERIRARYLPHMKSGVSSFQASESHRELVRYVDNERRPLNLPASGSEQTDHTGSGTPSGNESDSSSYEKVVGSSRSERAAVEEFLNRMHRAGNYVSQAALSNLPWSHSHLEDKEIPKFHQSSPLGFYLPDEDEDAGAEGDNEEENASAEGDSEDDNAVA